LRFVHHSWSRSIATEPHLRDSGISVAVSAKSFEKFLDDRLHDMTVLIACNPEDPDQIFGYIVGERKCIHFLYVKEYIRSEGIAKDLVSRFDATTYSYYSRSSRSLGKKFKLQFNPFHLWGIFLDD
jgi:hypothetical protein